MEVIIKIGEGQLEFSHIQHAAEWIARNTQPDVVVTITLAAPKPVMNVPRKAVRDGKW